MKLAVREIPPAIVQQITRAPLVNNYTISLDGSMISITDAQDAHAKRSAQVHAFYSAAQSTRDLYEEVVRPSVQRVLSGECPQAVIVVDGSSLSRVLTLHHSTEGLLPLAVSDIANSQRIVESRISFAELQGDLIVDKLAGNGGASSGAIRVAEDVVAHTTSIEGLREEVLDAQSLELLQSYYEPRFHQILTFSVLHSPKPAGKGGANRRRSQIHFISFALDELIRKNAKGETQSKSARHALALITRLFENHTPSIPFSHSKLTYFLKPALYGQQPSAWITCLMPQSPPPPSLDAEQFSQALTLLTTCMRISQSLGRNFPRSLTDAGNGLHTAHQTLPPASPLPTAGQQRVLEALRDDANIINSMSPGNDSPPPKVTIVAPQLEHSQRPRESSLEEPRRKPPPRRQSPPNDSPMPPPPPPLLDEGEDPQLVENPAPASARPASAKDNHTKAASQQQALNNDAALMEHIEKLEAAHKDDQSKLGVALRKLDALEKLQKEQQQQQQQQRYDASKFEDVEEYHDPGALPSKRAGKPPSLEVERSSTKLAVPKRAAAQGNASSQATQQQQVGPHVNIKQQFETYREVMETALLRLRTEVQDAGSATEELKKQLRLREKQLRTMHEDHDALVEDLKVATQRVEELEGSRSRLQGEYHEQLRMLERQQSRQDEVLNNYEKENQRLQEQINELTSRNERLVADTATRSLSAVAVTQTEAARPCTVSTQTTDTMLHAQELRSQQSVIQQQDAIIAELKVAMEQGALREQSVMQRSIDLEAELEEKESKEVELKSRVLRLEQALREKERAKSARAVTLSSESETLISGPIVPQATCASVSQKCEALEATVSALRQSLQEAREAAARQPSQPRVSLPPPPAEEPSGTARAAPPPPSGRLSVRAEAPPASSPREPERMIPVVIAPAAGHPPPLSTPSAPRAEVSNAPSTARRSSGKFSGSYPITAEEQALLEAAIAQAVRQRERSASRGNSV